MPSCKWRMGNGEAQMGKWWAGSGATAATAPHSGCVGATLVVAHGPPATVLRYMQAATSELLGRPLWPPVFPAARCFDRARGCRRERALPAASPFHLPASAQWARCCHDHSTRKALHDRARGWRIAPTPGTFVPNDRSATRKGLRQERGATPEALCLGPRCSMLMGPAHSY